MNDIDNFLAHYGKKGMKWGVVNDDDTPSSKRSSKDEVKTSSDGMSKAAAKYYKNKTDAELNADGKKKLQAKADKVFPHTKDSKVDGEDPTAGDLKEGRLSRNQKIALGVGGAVALGALAYYGNQKLNAKQPSPFTINTPNPPVESLLNRTSTRVDPRASKIDSHRREMDALFGPEENRGDYPERRSATFHAGLRSGKAFDRPEFTIPQSTTFQRLSNHAETGEGYSKGAYATFLKNDNRSYGSSEEFGRYRQTLTFQPTKEVRVPSTRTVLEVLKQDRSTASRQLTDDETIEIYHREVAGGDWQSPSNQRLMSALKSRGYSAVVDDADAGGMGDLPVVFFGETKRVVATPRTTEQIMDDINNVIVPSKRYT